MPPEGAPADKVIETKAATTTAEDGSSATSTTSFSVTVPFTWMWLLQSGWRPAIGWVCAVAAAVQFILLPMTQGLCTLLGRPTLFPPLDLTALIGLAGMALGFGALRSYDRKQGGT